MWRMVIVLVIVGLCVNTAAALPGSGMQQDPWRIESPADFNEFAADANYWDDYTRLETDVNLAGLTYTTAVIAPDADNSNWHFDGIAFTGVFDGKGHKITGLTVDDNGAGNDCLGLFGCIGEDGEVRNLGLECGSVSGDLGVGGLVGRNYGSVSNCYSTGSVSGDRGVGGLVGFNNGGSVSNCYSKGDVSGYGSVGGLVGGNYGRVSNCYSTGNVDGGGSVSGLVGLNSGDVSNCYSTGSVSGISYVGGLVGSNRHDKISSCYSTGDVNGVEEVGGLVGRNGDWHTPGGAISNCYSTGSVSGDKYVGGLVGGNYAGLYPAARISNCYSTGDVNGVTVIGGLVGANDDSVSNSFWDIDTQTHGITESIGTDYGTVTNAAGLPTAQMQTRSTFTDAGWDFVEIWLINNGATYPVLRQEIRCDLNGDGGVDLLDFAIFADHWLEGKID